MTQIYQCQIYHNCMYCLPHAWKKFFHVFHVILVPKDSSQYPGRCDFESNLCSYHHTYGDFQWVRTSGAEVIEKEFAPTRDHTTNTAGGSYMLADAHWSNVGDVARFASTTFQATGAISDCKVRKLIPKLNFFIFICKWSQNKNCSKPLWYVTLSTENGYHWFCATFPFGTFA